MVDRQAPSLPDGVTEASIAQGGRRRANPWSLVLLATIVACGASGLAGRRENDATAESAAARLHVRWPRVLRSGEIFEAVVEVEARKSVGKLVLSITPALLHETTLNGVSPEAADQSYEDGRLRFAFGPLAAGRSIVVKLDAQTNPSLGLANTGRIAVLDGDAELAGVDLKTRVLP